MIARRLLRSAGVALAAIVGMALTAAAQDYPSRPITLVVPFPAGASADLLARILGERLNTLLKQPVIVENISGAGGTLGVEKVVRAAPDGYTALIGNWSSNVGGPAVYPVTLDIIKDLQPVSRLTDVPLMLIGRKSLPATNLSELVAWLSSRAGAASAATIGVGSASQLCAIDLQNKTGARFQFVPYRGGAPAIQDVLGGQIDIMCGEASGMLPHVKAGTVTPFAVVQDMRWFAAPDIPTTAEAGLPSLELSFWHGLWLPAGTPAPVVEKLAAAVRDAFADPGVRRRLADVGQELPPLDQQTPAGLAAFHKASIERWWPVIRAANLRPE
ncbi:MAG: Bug family tripartite tricarboxylate transporter substrate binding protein [Xanthobacteraceae bacterium]